MPTFRVAVSMPIMVAALLSTAACTRDAVAPDRTRPVASRVAALDQAESSASDKACWGQATRAFAQLGELGEHASHQSNPRLGLRNVARALYEAGVLADDSIQALGAFLASASGLSIDACI